MLRWTTALALTLLCGPALGSERVAAFGFEWINTSLEPTRPDEAARIGKIEAQLAEALRARGFVLVDTTPVAAELARVASFRACGDCDLDLARQLGADLSAVGWVQKVSNLILNINLQVREVATGRLVRAGSVDIRGNDDASWTRGLKVLLERRVFVGAKG